MSAIRKYVTRDNGRELTKGVTKGDINGGACGTAKKLISLTQNFSVSIFSVSI